MLVPVAGVPNPREMNRRNRAFIPTMLKDQDPAKFPPVYIFNTFNREHHMYCGSKGLKVIPACPAGQPYGQPLALRAIEVEEYDLADGAGNMSYWTDDGIEVARDVIGVNSQGAAFGLYTTNLEWWGVFATVNAEPTKEELAGAKAKLTRMMQLIYENGKKLAAQGPAGLSQIGENHALAAAFLGVPAPWGTVQQAMDACPWCKNPVNQGAIKCPTCHEILDLEAAAKLGKPAKK